MTVDWDILQEDVDRNPGDTTGSGTCNDATLCSAFTISPDISPTADLIKYSYDYDWKW